MSSFAKTRCPKCGNVTQHHLGGFGFYGQMETHCKKCGFTYESVPNCIEEIPDRDDHTPQHSVDTKNLNDVQLSKFSTKELLDELNRRIK